MTDTEREQAIAWARYQMQQWASLYDWHRAHYWQEAMRQLIRERSEEQVRRMEQERGLA